MKRLRDLARDTGQAVLQLALPLFEPLIQPARNVRPEAPAAPLPPAARPVVPRSDPEPPSPSVRGTSRRVAVLEGHAVEYELRRTRRRTIGFCIDDTGLRVTAPQWVALAEIENALRDKERWILRKLVEWRDHARRRERLTVRWEDGAQVAVLGQPVRMRLDPSARSIALNGDTLHIGLPAGADAEQMSDAVQAWLQTRARALFAERLAIYGPQLGVTPSRWRLSSARTRWGSCAADGSIRLNWRLVHFPLDIVDYVVVHELAHLREMNHGPRFWATVQAVLPEFETARRQLKDFPNDLTLS